LIWDEKTDYRNCNHWNNYGNNYIHNVFKIKGEIMIKEIIKENLIEVLDGLNAIETKHNITLPPNFKRDLLNFITVKGIAHYTSIMNYILKRSGSDIESIFKIGGDVAQELEVLLKNYQVCLKNEK